MKQSVRFWLAAAVLAATLGGPSSGKAQEEAAGDPSYSSLPTLTLMEAVRLGMEYSPQLKASMEVVNQAKANIKKAYALLLPFLDLNGQYSLADKEIKVNFGSFSELYALAALNCGDWDVASMGALPTLCQPADPAAETSSSSSSATVIQQRHNWDFSVSAGVSLLNLRTWPQIFNVYTGVELARLQHEYNKDVLAFAIAQTYFGVSASQEAVRLARENLANSMRHMDMTEIRFKNGVALQNERVRSAISVVQARTSLDQAILALEAARTALSLLIGREDSLFQVESDPILPWENPESAPVDLGDLSRRKDLLMLDKSLTMARRSVTDVWAQFAPTLTGVWNWAYTNSTGFAGSNTSWRAIVTLSWNVFAGGMRLADLDEKKARVREIRFNKEQMELQARMEVASADSQLKQSQKALESGQEMLELAQENLSLVEKQYQLGVANQTSVIDAETLFKTSRIQVLSGRLQVSLSRLSLVRASGRFSYVAFLR